MLLSLRNKTLAALFLNAIATLVSADIVLDNAYISRAPQQSTLSSIYFIPGYVPQTEPGFLIQRSQAWRIYKKNNADTGYLLAYPPVYGTSIGAPTSDRQYQVRRNVSRANAYRLDYYKR